jgi:hypothetical protein
LPDVTTALLALEEDAYRQGYLTGSRIAVQRPLEQLILSTGVVMSMLALPGADIERNFGLIDGMVDGMIERGCLRHVLEQALPH